MNPKIELPEDYYEQLRKVIKMYYDWEQRMVDVALPLPKPSGGTIKFHPNKKGD